MGNLVSDGICPVFDQQKCLDLNNVLFCFGPRRSKKQNLISIEQFATSNDAPVRCHSDGVKGFKFKVKALSLKLKQIHFGHQQEISGHLGSVTGSLML